MSEQWPIKTIGEFCKTTSGSTPSKSNKDYHTDGTIPWLLSGEVNKREITESKNFITELALENTSVKLFPPNTVLVAMYGATAGQVGILRFSSTTNQAICGILPNDKIIPEYLYYALKNANSELVAKASGSAQPNLSQQKIKGTSISVPSLEEQQRIVSILDNAFRNIRLKQLSVEQNLDQSEALIQSILDSMYENPNWTSSTFDGIATIKGGKRLPKGHKYSTNKTAHPYISVKDFTNDGTIDNTNLKYIDEETFNQISRYTISSNDLYLSIAGTIGKTGIVPVELDGANLTENACKLIFNEGYDAKFVYYFTKTTSFLDQAGLLTKATGQPKLALTRLKQIVIRSPDSLEQERLVKRLDEIVHQSKLVEEKLGQELQNLDELEQSILQEAFSGKLTGGIIA